MAVPYGENQYIYGLHDPGGEHLLLEGSQAKGWVLVTEEIRANPNDQGGKGDFYKRLADRGLGVIVRLNHAYGPDGTIPLQAKYRDFAQRAANFVKNSPGAHIWIIGNEMNFEREQPRGGDGRAEPITPRRYAECYKMVRQAIKRLPGHENDQVVVGAIGPWNAQTPYDADPQGAYPANKIPGAPNEYPYHGNFGNFIVYMRDILRAIGHENCDAIAIHAYSHGYNPNLIFSEEKMGPPFQNYHYHFRTYQNQMNAIPKAFQDLPVYLTEANGDEDPGGVRWPDVNRGWIKNAYKEINDWNKSGKQQIHCVILYRWSRDDAWHLDGKGQVHQDLREAIAKGYQWDPSVAEKLPQPQQAPTTSQPTAPAYRTRYVNHNTPNALPAAQTLEVDLTLQNVGSQTWTRGGQTPFKLGFQWYNGQGQFLQFPAELNFFTALPNDVPPGGTVTLAARLRTPDTPGTYHLRWDMFQESVTWFTSQGDQGLLISPVNVAAAAAPTQPTQIRVQIRDASEALPRSTTSRYPQRNPASIRRIILHHTATPPNVTIHRIAEFQVKDRNLPGIAYHYCVTADGIIYQTQPLDVVTLHAGQQHSLDSVGVCLIGNFSQTTPPSIQLETTAALLALLSTELGVGLDQVFGYNELVVTGSPGATFPQWKGPLLTRANQFLAATAPQPTLPTPQPQPEQPQAQPQPGQKPLQHYMLFWYRGRQDWGEWDLMGAMDYIAVFAPTVGFSIENAKQAQFVTIVGGPEGVPANTEQILQAAGCQVSRVVGRTEAETRLMLQQLAAQGRRF